MTLSVNPDHKTNIEIIEIFVEKVSDFIVSVEVGLLELISIAMYNMAGKIINVSHNR